VEAGIGSGLSPQAQGDPWNFHFFAAARFPSVSLRTRDTEMQGSTLPFARAHSLVMNRGCAAIFVFAKAKSPNPGLNLVALQAQHGGGHVF